MKGDGRQRRLAALWGRINVPQMAVNQQPAHNVFVLIEWPV